MKARTRIPKRRQKPRRKRPELTISRPKIECEPWAKISMRMRLKWWNGVYFPKCGICRFYICSWEDLVPDHIEPGKMGGCKDNSESNLQPAHVRCNIEKGSKRIA